MRYCVMSKSLPLVEVELACLRAGGRNISSRPRFGQVFCDLAPDQVERLSKEPGIAVKEIRGTSLSQVIALPEQEVAALGGGFNINDVFEGFRAAFVPPLTGDGLTVAVLDSGIRSTHEALAGKVILERNFSDSETAGDVFGHGTSVAYLIAGGLHGQASSGVAPGAALMNIKVLNDDGEGTDEMLINGIDAVCQLVEAAIRDGKAANHPDRPNVINISAGAADDGDPDNPVRVACRVAVLEHGLQIVAAAGNGGSRMSTVVVPATDPLVVAIGGLNSGTFTVWDQSSRGPTKEGLVKPDFVLYATELHMADRASDEAYVAKSGTSFSAPLASGIIGLIWELGRREFGPPWYVSWYDVENVAPAVCLKPAEAPRAKDNDYGYGTPGLSALVSGAQQPAADLGPVMGVGMMALMLGMVVSAVRG
ncbi:MAG: peptidase S8 [Chloroflexi bacterium]|nr:peptidase S8 [Chloroflexota bacterium]